MVRLIRSRRFILVVICIIAIGVLFGLCSLIKAVQAQTDAETSLKEVMPTGETFKAVKSGEDILYYEAFDKKGQLIGAVFKTDAQGYASSIETLVGMLKDGTISAIKILAEDETPGLGGRVAEFNFTGQFKGAKDLNSIQAITGATISSRAVIDSVQKKAEEIKELLKNG